MSTCTSCGASTPNYTYICATCKLRQTVQDESEATRRHNDLLAREARRHESELTNEAIRNAAIHNSELANIEKEKLNELKKQTQILEEQGITSQDAFNEGKKVDSFSSRLFQNQAGFLFYKPYLNDRLNEAYTNGANEKLTEVFNEGVINLLRAHVKELALRAKEEFLEKRERINEYNDGIISEYVSINFNGAIFNFGLLYVNLKVMINNDTGALKFTDEKNALITDNNLVNEEFGSVFNFKESLDEVNSPKLKLERIEKYLNSEIEKTNQNLTKLKGEFVFNIFTNIGVIVAWCLFVFSLYPLFFGGFWITNFIAWTLIVTLGLIIMPERGWVSGKYLKMEENALYTLNNRLSKTRNEIGLLNSETIAYNSFQKINNEVSAPNRINIGRNFIFLILSFAITFVAYIYLSRPDTIPQKPTELVAQNYPEDIKLFLEKKETCDHFLGEEPYDNERRKIIRETIQLSCPGTDLTLEILLKKYAVDKSIEKKLLQYSLIGITETGAVMPSNYPNLRKKLLSLNWSPWDFEPLTNLPNRPFPEVIMCNDGICTGYFINNSGDKILEISYFMCGSDDTRKCSVNEDGYLEVNYYESISISEAKNRNLLIKKQFD